MKRNKKHLVQTTSFKEGIRQQDHDVLQWHLANLEYGCAGRLEHVSNTCWDQDDEIGGFLGHHVMFPKGYGAIVTGMVQDNTLNIQTNTVVTAIKYSKKKSKKT